jgi:Tfp pilus assembly protein PilN
MISINFASRNYRLAQRVGMALLATITLLIIVVAMMVWVSLSLRADTGAVERRINELAKTEEQFKPLLAERDRILKDFSSMSGLLASRRFSWTQLLTDIEKVFPTGVALSKVEYAKDGTLTLDGTAHSPESLRNLMVGLERSPNFRDAYLKHQSLDKGSISFNVVVIYKGHQASDLVQGK